MSATASTAAPAQRFRVTTSGLRSGHGFALGAIVEKVSDVPGTFALGTYRLVEPAELKHIPGAARAGLSRHIQCLAADDLEPAS